MASLGRARHLIQTLTLETPETSGTATVPDCPTTATTTSNVTNLITTITTSQPSLSILVLLMSINDENTVISSDVRNIFVFYFVTGATVIQAEY